MLPGCEMATHPAAPCVWTRREKGRAKAEQRQSTLYVQHLSPLGHPLSSTMRQEKHARSPGRRGGDTHGRAPAAMETAATVAPLSTRLLDTLSPALACSVHTDDAVCARRASGGRAVGVNASATTSKHSPAETETNTSFSVPWTGHCITVITSPGSCHVVLARGTCTACGMRSRRSDSSDVLLGSKKQRTRRQRMPSQRKQLGECERDHTAQR